MDKCKVTIRYKDSVETYEIRKGLGFQALCAQHRTPLQFDCRRADCGICIMRVVDGAENVSPPTASEKDFLQAMHADPDERFACQCRILGDVTVQVDY